MLYNQNLSQHRNKNRTAISSYALFLLGTVSYFVGSQRTALNLLVLHYNKGSSQITTLIFVLGDLTFGLKRTFALVL